LVALLNKHASKWKYENAAYRAGRKERRNVAIGGNNSITDQERKNWKVVKTLGNGHFSFRSACIDYTSDLHTYNASKFEAPNAILSSIGIASQMLPELP